MTSTSSRWSRKIKSIAQQSDIVISADGQVHISFLWDDLKDLAGLPATATVARSSWKRPADDLSLESADYGHCQLCPKQCGFNRNAASHPRCNDSLLRISNVGITYGDEPSIRGSHGSGAIMLAGCPLKCPSCHNPEKVANGEPASAKDFFRHCEALLRKGAHNLQLLSPTVHLPALGILLSELKRSAFPLPIVLKSSGYERVEELRRLEGLIDVYLPDLKFGSCSAWAVRAGVRNYFSVAREAIEEMVRQVGPPSYSPEALLRRGVLVRHVEAPLPMTEREEINTYLGSLEGRAEVSRNPNFTLIE